MRPIEGVRIIAFGQQTTVLQVVELNNNRFMCFIEPSIVVPSIEYTRDYIADNEIEKYL